MLGQVAKLLVASAVYGFSLGIAHSLRYALRDVLKFPLLILVTGAICALAYFMCARLLTSALSFGDVQGLVLRMYCDTSVLLASLSAVNVFLALTMEQPISTILLNDYPLFVGFNVLTIAICGSLALSRQAITMLRKHRLTRGKSLTIIGTWLVLSLGVGGQWAWYLRPFFGVSAAPHVTAFCMGTKPDFRGDTNFFEAVFHLVRSPSPSSRVE